MEALSRLAPALPSSLSIGNGQLPGRGVCRDAYGAIPPHNKPSAAKKHVKQLRHRRLFVQMDGRNLAAQTSDLEVYSIDSHNRSAYFETFEDLQGANNDESPASNSTPSSGAKRSEHKPLRVQEGLRNEATEPIAEPAMTEDLQYGEALAVEAHRAVGLLRAAKKGVGWSAKAVRQGLAFLVGRSRQANEEPDYASDSDDDDGIEPVCKEEEGRSVDGEVDESKKESSTAEDLWETINRWWNNPAFFRLRVSLSLANLSISLPTMLARFSAIVATFFPHQAFSLPILAPLLFGGGIVFKSVVSNLGFVLPRLAMSGAILWTIWALNYVLQSAISRLRDHGAVNVRVADVLVLAVELTASAIAVVTILSTVGVKVSSLLLPFFAAVALAGKDVWHNYFAGFFLFAAQPFRPGDTVALLCGGGPALVPASGGSLMGPGWFEGVCESVDLRYTVLRSGRHRLMVPNSHFVTKEFMVTDAGPMVARGGVNRSPRQDTKRSKGNPGRGGSGEPHFPGSLGPL